MKWTDLTPAQQEKVLASAPAIIEESNASNFFSAVDSKNLTQLESTVKQVFSDFSKTMNYTTNADLNKASNAVKCHFVKIIQKTVLHQNQPELFIKNSKT